MSFGAFVPIQHGTVHIPDVPEVAGMPVGYIQATADALAEKQRELGKAKETIAQMEALLRTQISRIHFQSWTDREAWKNDVETAFPHLSEPKR